MEQQVQTPKEPPPQADATSQPRSSAPNTPATTTNTTTTTTTNTTTTTSTVAPTSNPGPNPNPNQIPKPSPSQPQARPPATAFGRPWQQPSTFSHFSSSSPSSASSSSPSPLPSVSAPQRGGMAIGVPASAPLPSPSLPAPSQTSAFPGSFRQPFGALGRVGGPESPSNPTVSQGRPMQGMGMVGTLGSTSSARSGGVSVHQARPVQSSLRPSSSPTGQSPSTQGFQGHGLTRASGSSAPSPSQNTHAINQPWLSAGTQGKPPLPPSPRPPISSASIQQRSHIPQQHPPVATASRPQHMQSAQQQQSGPSHQPQEQQPTVLRSSQSLTNQPQMSRIQGLVNQKPASIAATQPGPAQTGSQSKTVGAENDEQCNRILSKRSIHELVCQIDPSEKLDPGVEDILVDIAEDFVESITTFGCSLAKHRKSDTLETKDILLHLERNWHMRPPGFSGDEIKTYRKPVTTDIHKERLAAIKRSIIASEAAHAKHHPVQGAGTAKGSVTKAPANPLTSGNINR